MYICLCNGLTDRRVREAAAKSGADRPSEVYKACGCAVQCGTCARALRRIVDDVAGICGSSGSLQPASAAA